MLTITGATAIVIDETTGVRGTYLESTSNLLMMVFLGVVAAGLLTRAPLPRWVLWAAPLVLLSLAGLIAGIVRARSAPLAALLLALVACTALNVVFVAEAPKRPGQRRT